MLWLSLLHAHTFDFPKWNATSFQIGPIRATDAGNEDEEEEEVDAGLRFSMHSYAISWGARLLLVLGYCSL